MSLLFLQQICQTRAKLAESTTSRKIPLHKLLLKQIKTCVEFRRSAWAIMLEVVFVWKQRESIYLSVVSVVRQIWSSQRGWETCGVKWWDKQNKCIRPAVFPCSSIMNNLSRMTDVWEVWFPGITTVIEYAEGQRLTLRRSGFFSPSASCWVISQFDQVSTQFFT